LFRVMTAEMKKGLARSAEKIKITLLE
jgi:hypothetical protein